MAELTSAGTQAAGLGASGARYTLLAAWALGIWSTLLLSSLSQHTAQLAIASALQLAGVMLLTRPGNQKLSTPLGLICALTALLSGLVVLSALASGGESWTFNFSAYLLALLTTRGNAWQGIVGGIVLLTSGLGFCLISGVPAAETITFLTLPLVAFVIGIVWRLVIAIAVQRERMHLGEAEMAIQASQASEVAMRGAQGLIEEVRIESGPALDAIRRGHEINDVEALQLSVLSEGIRDRIRSPQLRHPLLNEAVRAARERGVRVLLLGSEAADTPIETVLATAVARIVSQTSEGAVTVRAFPHSKPAALSVLVSNAEGTRRTSFRRDGGLLEQG